MSDGPTALVLTAAIDPRSCPNLVVADPAVRRAEYRAALAKWLPWAIEKDITVVFAESSGAALADFEAEHRAAVRAGSLLIHSRRVAVEVVEQGKGNAEAAMLRNVADDVLQPRGTASVIKCTGRLYVRNATAATQLPHPGGVQALLRSDLSRTDSRYFVADLAFLNEHLAALEASIDESNGRYLEHTLAAAILRAAAGGTRFTPLPRLPRFEGRSASLGARYDTRAADLKRVAHELTRRSLHRRSVFL